MEKQIPNDLVEDARDGNERALRVARFLVLEEMGYFGQETNVSLSFTPAKGTWIAAVRKRFSGTYGDVAGCHPADIEVAADMLGVFDTIFDGEPYKETY